MIRNIFLDRDGVINEVVTRDGGAYSPRTVQEFRVRKEFVDFYSKISRNGLSLFIVSNQPDVARGRLSQSELQSMTKIIEQQFQIREIRYCVHDDSDKCDCRKPKSGMIDGIIMKYCLKREECLIIGDSWKDMAAGRNAGIRTVYLENSFNNGLAEGFDFKITKLEQIITERILEG